MTDDTPLTIRPLLATDKPVWHGLWNAYLTFYQTTLPEAVYESTFARLISGLPGEFSGLIASQDGRAVGLAHYLFHRSCWKIENACYLQDLYTLPDMRGRGVGRALVQAVYAQADMIGAPGVYWLTAENNYRGRMLYDQIGTKTPFIKYNRAV
ncbi:MAG: GNAT family N-acetyltransferase [Paracoccaceae bacterium]|nr:GNAT family N-acetyltransferase [Paracoccaceae bacterium]